MARDGRPQKSTRVLHENIMPSKKSKKKGGAPKQEDDDDWEALLEAEAQVEQKEEAPKEEPKTEPTDAAPAPAEDAAAAFLASQGIAVDGGEETGGGAKKKKKKKKKGGGGGDKQDEKVRVVLVRGYECTSSRAMDSLEPSDSLSYPLTF